MQKKVKTPLHNSILHFLPSNLVFRLRDLQLMALYTKSSIVHTLALILYSINKSMLLEMLMVKLSWMLPLFLRNFQQFPVVSWYVAQHSLLTFTFYKENRTKVNAERYLHSLNSSLEIKEKISTLGFRKYWHDWKWGSILTKTFEWKNNRFSWIA